MAPSNGTPPWHPPATAPRQPRIAAMNLWWSSTPRFLRRTLAQSSTGPYWAQTVQVQSLLQKKTYLNTHQQGDTFVVQWEDSQEEKDPRKLHSTGTHEWRPTWRPAMASMESMTQTRQNMDMTATNPFSEILRLRPLLMCEASHVTWPGRKGRARCSLYQL